MGYCIVAVIEGVSKLASIWFVGTHGSCVRVLYVLLIICKSTQYTTNYTADARAVRPYKIAQICILIHPLHSGGG